MTADWLNCYSTAFFVTAYQSLWAWSYWTLRDIIFQAVISIQTSGEWKMHSMWSCAAIYSLFFYEGSTDQLQLVINDIFRIISCSGDEINYRVCFKNEKWYSINSLCFFDVKLIVVLCLSFIFIILKIFEQTYLLVHNNVFYFLLVLLLLKN